MGKSAETNPNRGAVARKGVAKFDETNPISGATGAG
jgi:hypothetical protein